MVITLTERILALPWPDVLGRTAFFDALGLEEMATRLDDENPSGALAGQGMAGSWASHRGVLESITLELPGVEPPARDTLSERFGAHDPDEGWLVGDLSILVERAGTWSEPATMIIVSHRPTATKNAAVLNAPTRSQAAASLADQLVVLEGPWPAWRTRRAWLTRAATRVEESIDDKGLCSIAALARDDGLGLLLGYAGRTAWLLLELEHGRFPESFTDEFRAALEERREPGTLGGVSLEVRPRPGGSTVIARDVARDDERREALVSQAAVLAEVIGFVELVLSAPWPETGNREWESGERQRARRADFFDRLGLVETAHNGFVWSAHPEYRGAWSDWGQLALLMLLLPGTAEATSLVRGGVAEWLTERLGPPDGQLRWHADGLRVDLISGSSSWLTIGSVRALDDAAEFERRRQAGELSD